MLLRSVLGRGLSVPSVAIFLRLRLRFSAPKVFFPLQRALRARGGPWAPPPRLSFVSQIFDSALGFWLSFFLVCGVRYVFSLGSRDFLSASCLPFKTRPLWDLFLGPSHFLLLFGCFLVAVVAFLFFSSSSAGETQTALRFVAPLVSLRPERWPRPSPSTRTPSSSTYTSRSYRPPLFFLFFRWYFLHRSVLPVVVGLLVCLWSLVSVGVSLSLSLSPCWSCLRCMHAFRCEETEVVAYKTAPPSMIMNPGLV